MQTKPTHQHDCDTCRYLGTKQRSDGPNLDYYVCEADPSSRSLLERFGSEPHEYASAPLFGCAELTRLDRIALFNGLELNEHELERLLHVLSSMHREQAFTRQDYLDLDVGSFGNGNVVFPTSWD